MQLPLVAVLELQVIECQHIYELRLFGLFRMRLAVLDDQRLLNLPRYLLVRLEPARGQLFGPALGRIRHAVDEIGVGAIYLAGSLQTTSTVLTYISGLHRSTRQFFGFV